MYGGCNEEFLELATYKTERETERGREREGGRERENRSCDCLVPPSAVWVWVKGNCGCVSSRLGSEGEKPLGLPRAEEKITHAWRISLIAGARPSRPKPGPI